MTRVRVQRGKKPAVFCMASLWACHRAVRLPRGRIAPKLEERQRMGRKKGEEERERENKKGDLGICRSEAPP